MKLANEKRASKVVLKATLALFLGAIAVGCADEGATDAYVSCYNYSSYGNYPGGQPGQTGYPGYPYGGQQPGYSNPTYPQTPTTTGQPTGNTCTLNLAQNPNVSYQIVAQTTEAQNFLNGLAQNQRYTVVVTFANGMNPMTNPSAAQTQNGVQYVYIQTVQLKQ